MSSALQHLNKKCLSCPAFLRGKCAGKAASIKAVKPSTTVSRMMTTEASPARRIDKREGDISSTFTTFSGRKAEPLPKRFLDLKRNLTVGFEEQIQKSWDDLVEVLKHRTEEVALKRESVSKATSLSIWSEDMYGADTVRSDRSYLRYSSRTSQVALYPQNS
jgi:hypothetical protein